LHRAGDLLHLVGALVGGQDLTDEDRSNAQRSEADQGNHDDDHQVAAGQLDHGSPPAWARQARRPDYGNRSDRTKVQALQSWGVYAGNLPASR
jgi:hypothetical protein